MKESFRKSLTSQLSAIFGTKSRVTLAGVVYTLMIGGAVLTETIFSWSGLGQYVVQSLQNADWAALQAVVLLSAALALIVYLLLDLINAAIDPRIRLGRS